MEEFWDYRTSSKKTLLWIIGSFLRKYDVYILHWDFVIKQGGLWNGALTEEFDDLKSFNLGGTTWDPNYTQGVDFLDHDLL